MRRHELSEQQWELIQGFFPAPRRARGRPWKDHRTVVNGILWVLHTGAPWRDLPERFGNWKTVYDRFNRWRRSGLFDRVLAALQVRLDRDGHVDWDFWCVDTTTVRAARAAAGAGEVDKKRTRASPPTTRWAAAKAGLAPNSTWSLTVREFPWPSTRRPGKGTRRSASSK